MTVSLPADPRVNDDLLRDLFENANDMIYATDLSGVITAINRAGERLTGFSRDELVGSNLARLIAPESLADAMRMMDPETAGAASPTYELDIVTKDDRRVAIEVRSGFLLRDGVYVGVQGIARDRSQARPASGPARQRTLRIEAINEIIAAADAAPDLAGVIDVAADRALAVLEGTGGGIWIGSRRAVRGLPADAGPAMLAALRDAGWPGRAPHAVGDWVARGTGDAAAVAWRRLGIRASLTVPIPLTEDRSGVMLVASARARAWTPEEVEFAAEVGRQVGATAEGLRLFRESRQRAELTERLVAAHDALHRSMSLAGVASEIGAAAVRLSGAVRADVYLSQPDGGVTCAWRQGSSAGSALETHPDAAQAWWERAARKYAHGAAAPLLFADVAALPASDGLRRFAEQEGVRAAGVWPLVYEGRMIAVVLCCFDEPHTWSNAECEVFQTFVWQAAAALQNARLFEVQRERAAELETLSASLDQSYMQSVLALARAVDARDAYTADHSERLAEWAEQVAERLGCGRDEMLDVRWAALLHDIGKIGVPDEILSKPGPLNGEEWRTMRQHPVIGERILLPLERMRRVAAIVRHHQEQWDGSGYPDGLRGEAIPLLARVLAVVDAYSAIIDRRPYKPARSHDDAVAELERCAGGMFDRAVVAAFCAVLAEPDGGRPARGLAAASPE